jgi:hypothetical protein
LDADGDNVAPLNGGSVVADEVRVIDGVRDALGSGVADLVAVAIFGGMGVGVRVAVEDGSGVDVRVSVRLGGGVDVRVGVRLGVGVVDGVGEGPLVGVGNPAMRYRAAPQSRRPAPCPACPISFAVACRVASTLDALAPAPRISAAQAATCGVAIDVPVPPP